LEVAERAGSRLPDGVIFVDLAGTAAADVSRRVAEAVGVPEDDDSLLLRSLLTVLRRRRLLLVLNNCARVIAVAAALAQGLAAGCARLRIVATSRRPLKSYGEVRMPLAPLSLPPCLPAVVGDAESAALRAGPSGALFPGRAASAVPASS
jgi:predicted ATPase